jgi:hypothetical protein
MVDFRAVRRAMVDGQVRTNDITDLDLRVWGASACGTLPGSVNRL